MLHELRPLMRLAGPVILAEVGWMSMGLVDTIMVGPLGPAAIAATGMGSGVFTAIVIFGMGLMLGLDAFVSQAHGAGDERECLLWLHQGVWLACILAPIVMAVTWVLFTTLDQWGLHPETRRLVGPYLRVIALSALPLLLYAAFRRYLQGMHLVRPIMIALVTANAINAAANWVLIYGNLGMPALGVAGSAWATNAARVYMAVFLYVAIRREHGRREHQHPGVALGLNRARIRRLVALGFPAASQVALEVGVFALATALAGRLDPVSSGAHQIALNIASLAFMAPLGLSSAAAVRVGYAIGAGDTQRATAAGWTALALGCVIMTALGLVFFLWPVPLLRAFSSDPRIIEIGTSLLAVAAAFQLFDGTQAVATGALRGIAETRIPMIVNVIGHWLLGLPVGYALCFRLGWGVTGLWIGLSIGLVVAAVVLTVAWWKRSLTLVMQNAECKIQN
jgi:MATE family multidrug resistance protein